MDSQTEIDVSLLASVRLLRPLSDDQKRELAAIAQHERVAAGTTIFREADPSDAVHLLLEGRVSLTMRVEGLGETAILTLGPGELLGWSALLPKPAREKTRVASARAVDHCSMLRLAGPDLLALCERDHDIGFVIMREAFTEMAHRLQDTRLQLIDMFRSQEG